MEVLQQLYYTLWVRDMTSEIGALAQLARAFALQAKSQGFESPRLHKRIEFTKKSRQ